MLPDDKDLKALFIDHKIVKDKDIKKAEEYAENSGRSFLEYLFAKEKITKAQLGDVIATSFDFPYANLTETPPDKDVVLQLGQELSENYGAVLIELLEKTAKVASDTPDEKRLLPALKKALPKYEIELFYALPEEIDETLKNFRRILDATLPKFVEQGAEAPVLFDALIDDAIMFNASDIHLEPKRQYVQIRFRVDGELLEAGRMPPDVYESLLNLIKIKNDLRTDVHLSPQDGSMHFKKDRVMYDIRSSIAPTVDGEKVVMRVLSSYVKVLSLGELGLTEDYQSVLEEAIKKPYGMVVIAGPTGSGKTTTLYGLLKSLNRDNVNITTIEDPVEYRIPGVTQIQVNNMTDVSFAKGLRTIVRQDPDVILVGEMRDYETADIAINAALTGILIFTTFHAGDSAITIPRLIDIGIEPFILASGLELIMSQRLLRKICKHCKVEYEIDRDDLKEHLSKPENFFKKKKVTLWKGEGCEKCSNTGFDGRLAIFESITMTPEIRDLTLKKPSAREVWELAMQDGSISLFDDGMDKVNSGETTIGELVRVAQPLDY